MDWIYKIGMEKKKRLFRNQIKVKELIFFFFFALCSALITSLYSEQFTLNGASMQKLLARPGSGACSPFTPTLVPCFWLWLEHSNSNYGRSCLAGLEFKSAMRQLIDFFGDLCSTSISLQEERSSHWGWQWSHAPSRILATKPSVTPLILTLPF